jgi:hypothetical protein
MVQAEHRRTVLAVVGKHAGLHLLVQVAGMK